MEDLKPIDEAAKAVGGLSALAEALNESIQVLSNWRSRGIPANRCQRIAALTGISVRRLRPNDWHEYWPDAAEVAQ